MKTASEYKIGQSVMVPMRGMCTIVNVEEETMLGQTLVFVHLKPAEGSGVIKMPARQLEEQGVRPLISKEAILAVLRSEEPVEDLSRVESVDRLERWTDLLRSGDYGSRIRVLREIALVAKRDRLDAQEQKFHRNVRLAARREIESVFGTSAAGAGRRLNAAIEK